jgi:hypothetical protein
MKIIVSFLLSLTVVCGYGQESPERINEVFKAYEMVNRKQDSIDSFNFEREERAIEATYRERLLIQSGNSGLASILISLGTNLGSLTLLAQGETQAASFVSIGGQALSAILLGRAFYLLTKAGNELADERMKLEGL